MFPWSWLTRCLCWGRHNRAVAFLNRRCYDGLRMIVQISEEWSAAFILGENSTTPDRRSEFLAVIMTECNRVDAILSELDASTEIIPLACRPTAAGRGAYSSTFDAPGRMRVVAARRTVLQHGGTITLNQTGPLKKLISLTVPLCHGQEP
jgi:hypothetical protein